MNQNKSNIERLLEMLDNPEAYTEREIRDIINADEQTREAYNLMVVAKDASSSARAAECPVDVDEAWHRFEQQYFAPKRTATPWLKIAATIIGVILISGIAVAAVHGMLRHGESQEYPRSHEAPASSTIVAAAPGDSVETITGAVDFDNEPLDQLLTSIADYYHVEVIFKDDDVRRLRFHYEWRPDAGLDKAIDGLNHFKQVNIEQAGNTLIVNRR